MSPVVFELAPLILAASDASAPVAAEAVSHPTLPMVLVGAVLIVTFGFIALDWLHKTVAALSGAIVAVVVALALGVYHGGRGYATVHDFIHHDLGVIGVIVGTSIIVTIAGESGLFHFLAVKIVKLTGGRPALLLPAMLGATMAFVTFLTIAPGVLIMVSLVLVITAALDDDPRPYILVVALGANSAALMTFASGIPTLMIGTSAKIPYAQFFVVSSPLALITAGLAYVVVRLFYGKSLRAGQDAESRAARVASFDEWALVKDRSIFWRSAAVLLLTIVGFATAQKLDVGLDFIAITGAAAALLFCGFEPEEAIKKVKWTIIIFFVGLFVLIGTVRETGLLDVLAGGILGIAGDDMTLVLLLVIPFVFLTAGIVDNIPVAATMIPVVNVMIGKGLAAEPLWWSLIAACNLGGNPTPVGSIAAVIALHALEKERGIKIGWGEYLKTGGVLTLLQIVVVFVYMSLYRTFDLFPALR